MRSAHLLVIAVLLACSWLSAQETPQKAQPSEVACLTPESQPAIHGPLRFDRSAIAQDPLLRLQATQFPVFNFDAASNANRTFPRTSSNFVTAPDLLPSDAVCLKIRSYLMARDRKGSDSTHPVGYSTCQPASRYRLRTTVGSSEPVRSR